MAELKLQQKQAQQLVMTQQLRQSIELLQMSSLELEAFVASQMAENPLLTSDGEEGWEPKETSSDESTRGEAESQNAAEGDHDVDGDDRSYDDWEMDSGTSSANMGYGDESDDPLARQANPSPSLKDHLRGQWIMEVGEGTARMIGLYLIDTLDDKGYLGESLEQVAATLGCEEDDVEEVLEALQQLDPAGVCARNLAECLALQLRDKGEFTPAFERMLAKLESIAKGEIDQVAKACGVSKEKLGEMLKTIRTLDPKPGLQFSEAQTSILPPDVIIRANKSGGWDVALNHDTLPKVLINQRYVARIEGSARAAEAKKFLTEKLGHANWLIKAIDSRANTLLAVATEIVTKQSMFFKYGVRHLKPLTLRQVAEATGVHESTVSRVTTGKTLASPRGTYDLKYFFTSHVEQDGDALSSEAVKAHIQKLISLEPADKPLSDDGLTEALKAMGIDIARRTVMKYREAMGIGSSVERRRQRKISGGLG